MPLEIIEIGHPVLREVATEVAPSDLRSAPVQQFIDDLVETKRDANGAGIAANQVANTWRIFVVEIENNPRYPYKPEYPLTVLINPRITFQSDARFNNYEGCLSIPNLRGVVERCPEIRVEGLDREGNEVDFEVKGITAGTFQHELDHLDGILFPDRVTDPKTFCTWNEFKTRYEDGFKKNVEAVVAEYGS
ncbi:MAG: peptide deformylase [Granulosicoccus sp.]|nr:peptide deformylase [Granulosicoccus sp.]